MKSEQRAILTQQVRRTKPSLAGMSYRLEPGEVVYITQWLGRSVRASEVSDPAQRISEDYFELDFGTFTLETPNFDGPSATNTLEFHADEHCPKCSIVSYVKQCPKCGASSPGNADYCRDCGYGPPISHTESNTPRFDAAYAECLDDTGKITRLEPLYNLCRRLEFETRQAELDKPRPNCPGCGNEIDPETCHCGDIRAAHDSMADHSFVPMGCNCGRVKLPEDLRWP